MIDYSPIDEVPIESAIITPYGPVTVDVDGSLTGCQSCGRAFGRFDSRVATVFAGDLHFRHSSC